MGSGVKPSARVQSYYGGEGIYYDETMNHFQEKRAKKASTFNRMLGKDPNEIGKAAANKPFAPPDYMDGLRQALLRSSATATGLGRRGTFSG